MSGVKRDPRTRLDSIDSKLAELGIDLDDDEYDDVEDAVGGVAAPESPYAFDFDPAVGAASTPTRSSPPFDSVEPSPPPERFTEPAEPSWDWPPEQRRSSGTSDLFGSGSEPVVAPSTATGYKPSWKTAELRSPSRGVAVGHSDPALDLPSPVAPPGYVLDRRGVLRYEHDKSCVPGQARVTLSKLWRFERRDGVVCVPEVWVRSRSELEWCADWAGPYGSTVVAGVAVAAYEVPEEVWDLYAAHPLAVTAPELAVANMVNAAQVADLAGLSRSAVPTYLARGVLPEPQARVANSPLWSLPPLGVWLARRREPGRPAARR